MKQSIPFSSLPGFSKLFLDFIDSNEAIKNRFPDEKLLENSDGLISLFGKSAEIRKQLSTLIIDSMALLEINSQQKSNLETIQSENTFFVTTGQQAGFLGGPFYTILKTFSAIRCCKYLAGKHPDLKFIPLFWVEDNDHDLREASTAYIWDKDNAISEFSCFTNIEQNEKIPVSETAFDEEITGIIEALIEKLPETQFKNDTADFIRNIYTKGANPSDSFIHIINELAKGSGLLFIKSSLIRKSGLWADLIQKELTKTGESHAIITKSNELLLAMGYHIQAKSSPVNLFYHDGKKRYKINHNMENSSFEINEKIFGRDEFLRFAEQNYSRFSPNVLLRPVFQDAVLPNVVYFGGPSEIGYLAQLKEVFDYFGVQMSVPMMRHSATLISPRISRLLVQSGKSPEYFFRRPDEIEKELNELTFNKNFEQIFDDAKQEIISSFEKVKETAVAADNTLKGSAEAALEKSLSLLEHLLQKVHAAEKRNNSLTYSRFSEINRYLYPHHTLNERILSVLTFVNLFGFNELGNVMNEINQLQSQNHHLLDLFNFNRDAGNSTI